MTKGIRTSAVKKRESELGREGSGVGERDKFQIVRRNLTEYSAYKQENNSQYYLFGFEMHYMLAFFKNIHRSFLFHFLVPQNWLTGEKEGSLRYATDISNILVWCVFRTIATTEVKFRVLHKTNSQSAT